MARSVAGKGWKALYRVPVDTSFRAMVFGVKWLLYIFVRDGEWFAAQVVVAGCGVDSYYSTDLAKVPYLRCNVA